MLRTFAGTSFECEALALRPCCAIDEFKILALQACCAIDECDPLTLDACRASRAVLELPYPALELLRPTGSGCRAMEGIVEHTCRVGEPFTEFVRLVVTDVESINPIKHAESVASRKHTFLPGLVTGPRLIRLGCLNDEDPGAPACEVEAGEHVALASLHVDSAEMNRSTVETGILKQSVKWRDRNNDLRKLDSCPSDPFGDVPCKSRVPA
jgi:hypothetical protein